MSRLGSGDAVWNLRGPENLNSQYQIHQSHWVGDGKWSGGVSGETCGAVVATVGWFGTGLDNGFRWGTILRVPLASSCASYLYLKQMEIISKLDIIFYI